MGRRTGQQPTVQSLLSVHRVHLTATCRLEHHRRTRICSEAWYPSVRGLCGGEGTGVWGLTPRYRDSTRCAFVSSAVIHLVLKPFPCCVNPSSLSTPAGAPRGLACVLSLRGILFALLSPDHGTRYPYTRVLAHMPFNRLADTQSKWEHSPGKPSFASRFRCCDVTIPIGPPTTIHNPMMACIYSALANSPRSSLRARVHHYESAPT